VTTIIDLEFDTTETGQPPLGDIASSLVSIDELLRDLATIVSYASDAEYREIQVAEIVMRSPLKVTLSLRAIPMEAITAFQEICREIIVFRDRSRQSALDIAEALCARQGITEREVQRIRGHIATLQNAAVPLKAVAISRNALPRDEGG
jgi:hypothetical protein